VKKERSLFVTCKTVICFTIINNEEFSVVERKKVYYFVPYKQKHMFSWIYIFSLREKGCSSLHFY